jgi:hypothetical protein
MENTNFNYSCKPIGFPDATNHYTLPQPLTVNPMPSLVSCTAIVKIPFNISGEGIKFCSTVTTVRNTETNALGMTPAGDSCVVKIADDRDQIFYISLTEGSYRFMQEWKSIACVSQGSGVYTDCSDTIPLISVEPKEMGYDQAKEIIVDSTSVGSAGSDGVSFTNPFASSLTKNLKTIFIIVGVVIGSLIIVVVLFIGIRACCKSTRAGRE